MGDFRRLRWLATTPRFLTEHNILPFAKHKLKLLETNDLQLDQPRQDTSSPNVNARR